MDEDGYIWFASRVDDVIISAGGDINRRHQTPWTILVHFYCKNLFHTPTSAPLEAPEGRELVLFQYIVRSAPSRDFWDGQKIGLWALPLFQHISWSSEFCLKAKLLESKVAT